MAKWAGVAVALLALGLGLVAGCGDDEDCINTSGTWFLTTDLSDGAYTDDQCSVLQRGCDITVACQNGTTSYGEVDGNQVSFPISWLSGSGNSPTVNRGHCVAEKPSGATVTLIGDSAGLGCGLTGAATLAPVHINVNCLELGNSTWQRITATDAVCPFEDAFVESYSAEQSHCVLTLNAQGAGIASGELVPTKNTLVDFDWPDKEDLAVPTGYTALLLSKGEVKDEEAAEGVDNPPRVLTIKISYWAEGSSVEERCAIQYRVPSRL